MLRLFRSLSESWRTLLGEGSDAFPDLLAMHAVASAPVGGLLVKRAASELVDGPFHAAHGAGCIGGEKRGQPVALRIERIGCNKRGEVADPFHLGGIDLFRGQEQPL